MAQKLLTDLAIHVEIEEEFYYPELENADEKEMVDEFKVEHHNVKILLNKLLRLASNDLTFDSVMKKMIETFRDHIGEEESEAMPHIEEILGKRKLAEIAPAMIDRKMSW